jgi:hypothetical protein
MCGVPPRLELQSHVQIHNAYVQRTALADSRRNGSQYCSCERGPHSAWVRDSIHKCAGQQNI